MEMRKNEQREMKRPREENLSDSTVTKEIECWERRVSMLSGKSSSRMIKGN